MLSEVDIKSAVKKLVEELSPQKIILFGSYARDEANDYSDLDLLVVQPENYTNKMASFIKAYDSIQYLGIPTDILLYSSDSFAKKSNWCSNAAYWAAREGKVLYEKP